MGVKRRLKAEGRRSKEGRNPKTDVSSRKQTGKTKFGHFLNHETQEIHESEFVRLYGSCVYFVSLVVRVSAFELRPSFGPRTSVFGLT